MKDDEVGDVFNKVISELAPEALKILWPEFEPIISKQVIKVSLLLLAKIKRFGYCVQYVMSVTHIILGTACEWQRCAVKKANAKKHSQR